MANRPLKIYTDLQAEKNLDVSGSISVSGSYYLYTDNTFVQASVTTSSDGMYDVNLAQVRSMDV